MPQFRQNFITNEWVIVAPERAKRPDQFAKDREQRPKRAVVDAHCPFCPGNEAMTPPATLTYGEGKYWQLRVVPNKFAAVNADLCPDRKNVGKFLSADGFGIAEVIIENPLHNETLATMPVNMVRDVLSAYKDRYAALSKNEYVDLITIFKNHGEKAGTSLEHPHSQIIATPIVPPHIRQLTQQAIFYHDTHGVCPYCVMIEEELKQRERIVFEGEHFVVFCAFAARGPFETRIYPKRHYSRFDGITDVELDELAQVLRMVLRKLYVGLNDPDYNFVITSSPISDGEVHYDHWRLVIVPKLTTLAGFEIGSGIFINIMPPEDSAKFLREINAD
jgi:UDPglucose--hexose-1-phosphate uridylyltransferase